MTDTAHPGLFRNVKFGSAWTTLGVSALLAFYLVASLGASLHKGVSYDEGEQLAVGYNIWLNHDFRMEGADGDLTKRWATLPYLVTRPNSAPVDNEFWENARAYVFGYEFLFLNSNPMEWLLLQGRVMIALMAVMLGLLVFNCSHELFGALGGVFSLVLFVFSPHMLAFGGIVSTEIPICFALLGATWAVWRLLHEVTWGRLLWSLGFASILMLAKLSSLVIFPVAFLLVLAKLFSRKPLQWRLGREVLISRRGAQLRTFTGLFVLHCLCAWVALWAHYDFRFAASSNPKDPALIFRHYPASDPVSPMVAVFMDWLHDKHLLPDGFLRGVHTLLTSNDSREAFTDGKWSIGGSKGFFFQALWDKTSPVLFILLIVGLVGWWIAPRWRVLRQGANSESSSIAATPRLYDGLPYFTLAGVYFIIAVIQNVDVGHRHILPIYPPLYILGGGAVSIIWSRSGWLARVLLAIMLASYPVESVRLYPDYLAYFNPLVGGAEKGYEHLVDSSLDWGMNLPAVKNWLDENNPNNRDTVFLAYFGTDSPEYYDIVSKRLPSTPDWRPKQPFAYAPGIYVISATLYQSDCTYAFGPWNSNYDKRYQKALRNVRLYASARKDPVQMQVLLSAHPLSFWEREYSFFEKLRFSRLCAWLRNHRPVPDAVCGYSILVWRLSESDLEDVIYGPPPEIDDDFLTQHPILRIQ